MNEETADLYEETADLSEGRRSGLALTVAIVGVGNLMASILGFAALIYFGPFTIDVRVDFFFRFIFGALVGLVTVILAIVAIVRINNSKGTLTGEGQAWIGLNCALGSVPLHLFSAGLLMMHTA